MMKMSRDRLKLTTLDHPPEDDEEELCIRIKLNMQVLVKKGMDKHEAMDAQWELMYELASVIMKNTVKAFLAK